MKKPEQDPSMRYIKLRTAASDKKKALNHYQELRRSGKSVRAVVISEDAEGTITVLGQMLTPQAVAELMLMAAQGVAHLLEDQKKPRMESHHEIISVGDITQGTIPKREVTLDADGIIIPPKGENLVSCGECHHPRWHLFHFNGTDQPARYACAHCGNEVKFIPIYHEGGTA